MSQEQIDHVRRARTELRRVRDEARTKMDQIVDRCTAEKRNLRASEQREFDALVAEIKTMNTDLEQYDDRIEELRAQTLREDDAAEVRRLVGGGYATPRGGDVYRPDGSASDPSFFRDLRSAKLGDLEAAQRLARNDAEARAMGNTDAAGGAGGEFAPPAWLVDEFVKLARAGRVTADRCVKDPLPSGVSSINLPKVSVGTKTGVQATQNTSITSQDMTTTAVSSGITTIAGKNVVSQQLLDQSAIPFDRVILGDLAADYARELGSQVLSGSDSGGELNGIQTYFTAHGTVNVSYTTTQPAVAGGGGFYAIINQSISAVASARFLPPNAIVMHPRRWSWVAGSFDGSNRPLVSPSGNAFNQIADASQVAAQGPVGEMAGLPVYVDPNIPIDLGAGTDEDVVLVGKFDDLYLWEAGPRMQAFDAPYADTAGVLFRALGYAAFIPHRYASSVSVISGTGLVTPTW